MVEKWLAQVEVQMRQSVKDSCMMAVQDYYTNARGKWVLQWPGQVVICGSCIHWTAEVSEALTNNKIHVSTFYFLNFVNCLRNIL